MWDIYDDDDSFEKMAKAKVRMRRTPNSESQPSNSWVALTSSSVLIHEISTIWCFWAYKQMFSLRIWCWQWATKSNWNTENIYFRTLTLVSGLNICTHHHKAQKQSIQFRYYNMTFWSVLCYDNAQKAQIQKSKNFPDSKSLNYPVTFWIIQKVFILFGQFLDCPDSFWIFQTVFRLSGQSLDNPDSFLTIRIVSLPIRLFWANIYLTAKTFRVAMLPPYHGFSNSGKTVSKDIFSLYAI